MILNDIRKQLAETGRQIYELKLVSPLAGNISARDPQTGLIGIKPSGVHWLEIQPEDIVIIDDHGNKVDGQRKPSTETPMHTLIYRNFPDAMAVVHTHSPIATGFAAALKPIPAVNVNAVDVGGEVPVTPYYPPGSQDLAEAVTARLRGRKAVLLGLHGVLCYGQDLDEAVYLSLIVEDIARLALVRTLLGSEAHLTEEQLAAITAL